MPRQDNDAILDDARNILDDAVQWTHHGPGNWAEVDRQLQLLQTGVNTGDPDTIRQATVELELLSPLRCWPPRRDPDAVPIPAATAALVKQAQTALNITYGTGALE